MIAHALLNDANRFALPGGTPFRLHTRATHLLEGVIPKGIVSVSATLRAEKGSCSAKLALFAMPTTVGGDDGAEVASTTATITTEGTTLTLATPTDVVPTAYIVRLSIASPTEADQDTVQRAVWSWDSSLASPGTAAFTSGSTSVTGTGTSWTSALVGRVIAAQTSAGLGTWFVIAAVGGATSITLASNATSTVTSSYVFGSPATTWRPPRPVGCDVLSFEAA